MITLRFKNKELDKLIDGGKHKGISDNDVIIASSTGYDIHEKTGKTLEGDGIALSHEKFLQIFADVKKGKKFEILTKTEFPETTNQVVASLHRNPLLMTHKDIFIKIIASRTQQITVPLVMRYSTMQRPDARVFMDRMVQAGILKFWYSRWYLTRDARDILRTVAKEEIYKEQNIDMIAHKAAVSVKYDDWANSTEAVVAENNPGWSKEQVQKEAIKAQKENAKLSKHRKPVSKQSHEKYVNPLEPAKLTLKEKKKRVQEIKDNDERFLQDCNDYAFEIKTNQTKQIPEAVLPEPAIKPYVVSPVMDPKDLTDEQVAQINGQADTGDTIREKFKKNNNEIKIAKKLDTVNIAKSKPKYDRSQIQNKLDTGTHAQKRRRAQRPPR